VAKEEWGKKRQCLNCSARFYDLNRVPIVCPTCETVFEPEPLLKSRRWQGGAAQREAEKVAPEKAAVETEDDITVDVEDDEDDDSADTLLADDDDDDDITEVIVPPAKPGAAD